MHVVRKAVSYSLAAVPAVIVSAALLGGCHGSDTTVPSLTPPTATFTDTVTPGNLTVSFDSTGSKSADGTAATSTWTFGDQVLSTSTQANAGSPLTHVYAQPGTYDVTLTVTDDHGSPVSITRTIYVTGTPATVLGVEDWAFISGSKYANNTGSYETQFTPNPSNAPSARQLAATWYSGGKLWMFGGGGYDSTGNTGAMNDLWNCTPGTGSTVNPVTQATVATTTCTWTWVAGSNKVNTAGIYPASAGQFSATSLPGARTAAASWTDLNGNMWLFGGSGFDSAGTTGVLNDLWSFSANGQAEWVNGLNVVNDPGAADHPPARSYPAFWTDSNGNFWLFGGESVNSSGTVFYLNDLWCFTPNYGGSHPSCANEAAGGTTTPHPGTAITTGTWTQITAGTNNGPGTYGTQGTAAATNIPGSRINPQTWVDGSGNLWMFGGSGYDSTTATGSLSDVWMLNPKTKLWTYMAGSSTMGAAETGSAQGTYAAGNTPSARLGTVGWTDASGTVLWLFGGSGTDSTGTSASSDGGGALNELWAFNTVTRQWAYVAGSTTAGTASVIPVPTQGVPSIYAIPGSRLWSSMWVDASHNVWILGGSGDDVIGTSGYLNDLWEVTTPAMPH